MLTRREREIALLVAEDLKNISIASRLTLSPATVATYIQRIQSRLGLSDRQQIKAWVQARGQAPHRHIVAGYPPADAAQEQCSVSDSVGHR